MQQIQEQYVFPHWIPLILELLTNPAKVKRKKLSTNIFGKIYIDNFAIPRLLFAN